MVQICWALYAEVVGKSLVEVICQINDLLLTRSVQLTALEEDFVNLV